MSGRKSYRRTVLELFKAVTVPVPVPVPERFAAWGDGELGQPIGGTLCAAVRKAVSR